MKHFRKIWTAEVNEWVKAHATSDRKKDYKEFIRNFPKSEVTQTGYYNQRSRLGIKNVNCVNVWHGSRKPKPLYSEHEKKGYVRIKVAQPSVWMMKSKWVYMETHPWEDFSERSNYIFLDGNNRNFSPENIERVPLKLMGIFASIGGTVPGNPEATKLNLTKAKLKSAIMDAAEKNGMTTNVGTEQCRVLTSTLEENRKKYLEKLKTDPEMNKQQSETHKKYWQKIKADPERYKKILLKNKLRRQKKKNKVTQVTHDF